MMNDVINGDLDVGFLPSGWLEIFYPQNTPLFKILSIKDPRPNYQGEPFPFPTGSRLIPEAGLAAAPYIPWQLQKRIAIALTELDSANRVFNRGEAARQLAWSFKMAAMANRRQLEVSF